MNRKHRNKIKNSLHLLVFTLLIIGPVGCSSSKEAATQGEEDNGNTVRIGYVTLVANSPAIIAEQKNLMEAEGLNAEFYPFANGPDLYKALASGKLDVAYAGVPAAVIWVAKGAKVKAIAKVSEGEYGLITKSNSGIEEPIDLKDKKIGSLVRGSGTDLLLRGFILPEGNLTDKDVSIVQMTMAVMEQSVNKGSVDAAILGEPFLTYAELHGLKVVKKVPDPAQVVLVSEDYLKDNKEKVEIVMNGHKAAIEFLNNNKKESAEILAKSFNVPEVTDKDGKVWSPSEGLEKALEGQSFEYTIDEDDYTFYQELADTNYELEMIDKPFEVKTLFDSNWTE